MKLLEQIKTSELFQEVFPQLSIVHDSPEGNTLEIVDEQTAYAQINFHTFNLLELIDKQPIRVLEIGTNKGMFGLFLLWFQKQFQVPIQLVTIDPYPKSLKAVEILQKYGLNCKFVEGPSQLVLGYLSDLFDYAWVDGHHGTENAFQDLQHCSRLKPTILAIDDTNYPEIEAAIKLWLPESGYSASHSPWLELDQRKAQVFKLL